MGCWSCPCVRNLTLIGGILFAVVAIIVVIFGYVVPMIKSSDYTLQACKVTANNIQQTNDYEGIATLTYLSLTKDILVVTSPLRSYVQTYLNANYKVDSTVQCLVSSDDIRVSILISNVGLIFTIVLAILSVICMGIFLITMIFQKNRRSSYVDLDATRPPPL